jgi:hypothetical protein
VQLKNATLKPRSWTPPDNRSGRSELTLADIVVPENSLRSVVEEGDFLSSVKEGYAKHAAWRGILENPEQFPKFKVADGLVSKLNDLGEPRLVLPDVIHKGERATGIAIQNAHEILGHLGFHKTLDYLRRYYWWSTMVRNVEKYVSSCETCQTTKRSTQRRAGLLHQLPIPEAPWSSISMDFVGPFPASLDYNCLWVVMCCLTSQVHLIPVKTTINVLELAYEFLKGVVRLHGLPRSIVFLLLSCTTLCDTNKCHTQCYKKVSPIVTHYALCYD